MVVTADIGSEMEHGGERKSRTSWLCHPQPAAMRKERLLFRYTKLARRSVVEEHKTTPIETRENGNETWEIKIGEKMKGVKERLKEMEKFTRCKNSINRNEKEVGSLNDETTKNMIQKVDIENHWWSETAQALDEVMERGLKA